MNVSKASTGIIILFFLSSMIILTTVSAQDDDVYINYFIKPDGTLEPNNAAIIQNGNNYVLTQNISGTVIIQKDHAVFDGAGFTVKGNALKGAYNLSDNVLYLGAGFNLTNAWNVTVQNVRIENCVNGISLVNAHYCRILNCTIIENAVDGIKVAWSSNNSIVWNYFDSNGDDAIQLVNAQDNHIMANNMTSGSAYRSNGNGLQLNGNCSHNLIEGNIITDFDTGLFIDATNGNVTANIISYNNFTNNKWNGAFIAGTANIITLNNFYGNGLLSEVNNNCSGNYWNTTASIFDESPLDTAVNIDITPVFIELPYTEPAPTSTPKPAESSPKPTPKPYSNPPTSTQPETTQPTATPTPAATPDIEPTQQISNIPTLLIATAIISIGAVVSVPLVFKSKIKGSDKKL
jgi:parallel beta-helix repeat protein